MGGGGGGKLLAASTGSLPTPARVGAWVTRLGGGMEAPTVTGGPNLLRRGAEAAADEAPLPLTAVGSDPFLTHGILPTKAAFFLAGGPGSGVFLVP